MDERAKASVNFSILRQHFVIILNLLLPLFWTKVSYNSPMLGFSLGGGAGVLIFQQK